MPSQSVRPPLRPAVHDRKGWWENFWLTQPNRFGPPSRNVLAKIDSLIPNPAGLAVVDIGSGNGRYAIEFGRRGMLTTAIEWTRSGSELVATRARENGTRITVINHDFLTYSDLSKDFDVVFSSGFLEEVAPSDQPKALANIAHSAKIGALIILKFCSEIDGRGTLVDASMVDALLKRSGISVIYSYADPQLRVSRSDMTIMTSTIIGRRVS